MEDMIKMRDAFRQTADIIDEFVALKPREDAGEDVTKESESILGRFMFKMMELQAMQEK